MNHDETKAMAAMKPKSRSLDVNRKSRNGWSSSEPPGTAAHLVAGGFLFSRVVLIRAA